MSDHVKIEKGAELARKLKNYSDKAETEVQKAVLKGCIAIEGEAKLKSPVDTGYMRASITHQVQSKGHEVVGLVGTNVEYAPYVEYGAGKRTPKPFLHPAYEKHIEQIKGDIKQALKFKR